MIKNLSTIESDRQGLVERLNEQKSLAERNRWGQFATPQALAEQVVNVALRLLTNGAPIRYAEPGFGTGPFYSALRRTTARVALAKGIELDPLFATAARNLWRGTGLRIVESDFTKLSPPSKETTKFDLIICNPPYVRHHHIEADRKRWLQQQVADRTNISISGLAGLYSHFMLLSQQWMSQGGVGAWLVPAEFMDVNYGEALKKFLLDNVTLRQVHRFDPTDLQFDDALVSSVVIFFENSLPPAKHRVQFTRGGSVDQPAVSRLIDSETLREAKKWTQIQRPRASDVTTDPMLSDLFWIKRGIATGCNEFFMLTEQKTIDLSLPKQFLRPILPSPRYLKSDTIEARSDGSPEIEDRRFLLSCELEIDRIKQHFPNLFNYLNMGAKSGVQTRYLCSRRDPWYRQEDRQPAPFLCTYMGRSSRRDRSPFRFIMNRSKAIAANVYLLLYPKQDLAAKLAADQDLQESLFQALRSITPESLIGEGRVYGGGLHKVEPKELAKVRLAVPGF